MFLSKEEKILVLLYRIQKERNNILLGKNQVYDSPNIIKMRRKVVALGGNETSKIVIE